MMSELDRLAKGGKGKGGDKKDTKKGGMSAAISELKILENGLST